ncbi:hypothetical protein QUB70_18430 [Microcoleus sp. A003_D6]|uniref:hypothetical protein n=1 Tax=Microcoleus sp. A003_D6 TaxID=3055266 RepID=UPI002FD4CD19
MGEGENGRMGEGENGRMGEWENGRMGEWELCREMFSVNESEWDSLEFLTQVSEA